RDVAWLAAPEREGRGPGTTGIEAAAEWLAERFGDVGLTVPGQRESVWQPFEMTLEAKLGPAEANRAELVGPPAPDGSRKLVRLTLGEDFTPLAIGGSGKFDLPLAFVGYGITAPAEHYDDYAPLAEVEGGKGRGVIVLRQEPQKDDPHGAFDGNQTSEHAALVRKAANASEHEAGGVIFCNDASATESDALMDFRRAGGGENGRQMPVLQISRSIVADLIERATGSPLTKFEAEIDKTLEPQSRPLDGWRIRGEVTIERQQTDADNIVGVLPGTGKSADGSALDRDVVILGAHYDHLGYGDSNSLAPGQKAIHHGADDNASGTAMLLEVARQLKAMGPFPRTVLFMAFAGEERGLLGSGHYTSNPLVPLKRTAAMVNLDMVGRLVDDKLIIHGTGTGTGFDPLIDRLTEAAGFTVAKE
nr:M20/M25/M40 family metallo-hydrolase [Pirellulales bacterium]